MSTCTTWLAHRRAHTCITSVLLNLAVGTRPLCRTSGPCTSGDEELKASGLCIVHGKSFGMTLLTQGFGAADLRSMKGGNRNERRFQLHPYWYLHMNIFKYYYDLSRLWAKH
mmetsp:Transcript_15705/g.47632  ORF Transcript_15705/g.47632 Transcript_15705/m.47632 type:complete len:112 (-) Transcript_15705:1102-1437(-)